MNRIGNQQRSFTIVKDNANSVFRNPEVLRRVRDVVMFFHIIVAQGYFFAKYIFMRLLHQQNLQGLNRIPGIHELVNQNFFYRVLVTLAGYRSDERSRNADTIQLQHWINYFLGDYLLVSGYSIPRMSYLHNVLKYEATKMLTAYLNMIKMNFSKVYNRLVNLSIDRQTRYTNIVQQLREEHGNNLDQDHFRQLLRERVRLELTNPIMALRTQMALPQPNPNLVAPAFRQVITDLAFVRQTYPDHHVFGGNDGGSIHFDCVANPELHIRSYFAMIQNLEQRELRHNQCFPLRTAFSPKHITFDKESLIELCGQGSSARKRIVNANLRAFFNLVFLLEGRTFRNQPQRTFRGMIVTDGYGVSIIFSSERGHTQVNAVLDQDDDLTDNQVRQRTANEIIAGQVGYFNTLPPVSLQELGENIVFIDPGRRDLLFMMRIDSEHDNPQILRYTSSTSQLVSGRKHAARRRTAALRDGNTLQNQGIVLEPNMNPQQSLLHRLAQAIHNTTDLDVYQNYLAQRRQVHLLYNFFSEYREVDANGIAANVPLYRHLRFKAYIGKVIEAIHIRNEIKYKFGQDAILIIGNWSASHQRFQVPTKGKGMRNLLAKEFRVMLLDEFKTSSVCPFCDEPLEKFLAITNPRQQHKLAEVPPRLAPEAFSSFPLVPLQRNEDGQYIEVRCHGLLRCTGNCTVTINGLTLARLFNRDLVAVLNFRRIFVAERAGQPRPAALSRQN